MQMMGYRIKRISRVEIWFDGYYRMTCTSSNQKEFKIITESEIGELLNELKLSELSELAGVEILEKREGATTKKAYIPKGATITLAARSADGELIDLKLE